MKLKCKICGKEIKGAQGAMPHLRMAHGVGTDDKFDLHRSKFELVPEEPSRALVKAEPLVRISDDDVITVVPNMVVVTDGKGRIGILEWHDHD